MLDQWGKAIKKQGNVLRKINDNGSIDPYMDGKEIARIVEVFGLELRARITPEDLRKGYAQLALQLGHSFSDISKQLGHRNVGETIRYLKSKKDAIPSVSAALFTH